MRQSRCRRVARVQSTCAQAQPRRADTLLVCGLAHESQAQQSAAWLLTSAVASLAPGGSARSAAPAEGTRGLGSCSCKCAL
ncbi:hypothetical protein HaLaN_19609, partial [Haematococcus lacustris]